MGLPRHESKHRIQAERAVLKTAPQSAGSHHDGPLAVTKAATFPLGRDLHGGWTSGGSEHQRVAAAGLVDEVHRDREIRENLPDPPNVVVYLLGEEGWVGPGVAHDLAGAEVAVGMVK